MAQDGLHVGFGGQVHLIVGAPGAFGPHPDLAGRLLARDIQRPPATLGPPVGDREQQGRLADSGIAGQQGHRSGDHPAAEHPVKFTDPGGHVPGAVGVDRGDRDCGGRRDDTAHGSPSYRRQ